MTATDRAVKKASHTRLMRDYLEAVRVFNEAVAVYGSDYAPLYLAGYLSGSTSLSLRACLVTAWGE